MLQPSRPSEAAGSRMRFRYCDKKSRLRFRFCDVISREAETDDLTFPNNFFYLSCKRIHRRTLYSIYTCVFVMRYRTKAFENRTFKQIVNLSQATSTVVKINIIFNKHNDEAQPLILKGMLLVK